MIMFRILFSLACWCHHINLDKICQDYFEKDLSSNRRPCPDRYPQSFSIRWKAVFFPDYRNRSWKGGTSIHRRRQPQKHCCSLIWWRKNLRLKTRKRRNWLGLAGVAHPRRMRRSLTSLSHPTETSNKVRAFHFIYADHSWETVEKFPLLLTWCALQSKVFIKTDSQ